MSLILTITNAISCSVIRDRLNVIDGHFKVIHGHPSPKYVYLNVRHDYHCFGLIVVFNYHDRLIGFNVCYLTG